MSFSLAQTFFVDKSQVANAAQIFITSVDLWVKGKPLPVDNSTGIEKPGMAAAIVETIFGVPRIVEGELVRWGRMDYDSIQSSSDASVSTNFRFSVPFVAETDKEYAIIVAFEGGAEYQLWTSVQGDYLVGTNRASPGASGKYTGNYFSYTNTPNQADSNTSLFEEYSRNWRANSDRDLKFRVNCSRFYNDGYAIYANNTLDVNVTRRTFTPYGTFVDFVDGSFIIPTARLEFLTFDEVQSVKEMFVGGQMAYQNTFFYPGGWYGDSAITVSTASGSKRVVAEASLPDGNDFIWSDVFADTTAEKWLVLATNDRVNVRKIGSFISNTEIELTEAVSFTNAAAKFMITPVGQIDSFNKGSPFGVSESFLMLANSSANSTVRFVNNTIESVSIPDGGTGYSNSDILYVQGFENVSGKVTGGYKAEANLVTNSSGGITAIYFSNAGAGFVNSDLIETVIANSTSGNTISNTSSGADAVFSYTVGATIKTDLRANNNFRNIKVVDLPLSEVIPFFEVVQPAGVTYDMKLQTKYERQEDNTTFSGYVSYIDTEANSSLFTLKMFQRNQMISEKLPLFVSRSNEFVTNYSNGALNDQVSGAFSNAIQLILTPESNNDFQTALVNTFPVAQFAKYIINNDYTNEHTDQGNAWAKHITKKIQFERPAEDLRVFLTAYKPSNTDLKVYARIYNVQDPEAFDDKDWSLLELKDGVGLVSSTSDTNDFIELAYGFPQYPNTEFTCNGIVTASNNSSNLVGVGTTFSSNLAVGDLIRIYQPLFEDDHLVCVVNAIANDTQITINAPILNDNLLGAGLKVDKLEFKHQAFNNIMGDNTVRYYNSSMMEFDAYNHLQIKVVMLSSVPNKIPRIDDIRAVRVSI